MHRWLNGAGKAWCALSFAGAALCCLGFYAPYWTHGRRQAMANETSVSFGPFRECVHSGGSEGSNGSWPRAPSPRWTGGLHSFMQHCSPYWTFAAIPSFSWQTATVLCLAGCTVSLFVSYITLLACCMKFMTRGPARAFGLIQLMAGICLVSGCILFPTGWGSSYVAGLCGEEAGPYKLGSCKIGWAYYVTMSGTTAILLGACFSAGAGLERSEERQKERSDIVAGVD